MRFRLQKETEGMLLANLYQLAYEAGVNTYQDAEGHAVRTIEDYSKQLTSDLEIIPEHEREQYKEKYISKLSNYLRAESRTASSFITGPANFPVARNQKKQQSARNRYNEFTEWRDTAFKWINKRIEDAKSPQQKEDEEFKALRSQIISSAATIIGIDNGTERGYSRALFVSNLTGRIERLANNGKSVLLNRCLDLIEEINKTAKKPVISARHKIWALREAAADKAAEIEETAAQGNREIPFDRGMIIINFGEDRVQIRYNDNDKPDEELRRKLQKVHALRWSPTRNVWQRQLTRNGCNAVMQATGAKFSFA